LQNELKELPTDANLLKEEKYEQAPGVPKLSEKNLQLAENYQDLANVVASKRKS